MWAPEPGTDEVSGTSSLAIESYFETGDISMLVGDKPQDRGIHCEEIEPDFVQSGDMTVQVRGHANARAPWVEGEIKTFPETAVQSDQQLVPYRANHRIMRFKFSSNVAGGDYQMGQCLAHIGPSDARRLA